MEYYSAIKKKEFPSFTTWMDLKGIMLNEVSQTSTICSHSCRI